ncbi:Pseudomonas avirulence D protein (AvrD) [uncultured archaeon]|nr:Pseudomonas avirulence D protein (AvrD) [uncultured archaeon]
MGNNNKRIVISGTYGTGKSTLTAELSKRTGIPTAVARGMRDILPETFPGKKLEECNGQELMQLGIIRYGERVALEKSVYSGFISDGSALHEWAYGYGREIEGAMGRGTELTSPEYKFAMDTFGEIVKRHAKQNYTHVVHLPVEFPLPRDGHRPVSEAFRSKADEILMSAWRSLGFEPIIVRGNVQQRMKQIVSSLDLEESLTSEYSIADEGTIYFDRVEDILGDPRKRFFSNGYRNVQHNIRNVLVNPAETAVSAKVNLAPRGAWAVKDGKPCRPHFSSIDAILVCGQLAQAYMYTIDNVVRDETSNLWLRDLSIKTGSKPIEDCEGVDISAKLDSKYISRAGKKWHLATFTGQIGQNGFKIDARVGYQLPDRLC